MADGSISIDAPTTSKPRRQQAYAATSPTVMAGLVPAIHASPSRRQSKPWMPGSSPGIQGVV